ncbi:MAG: BrnT family toxin [Shinella sp.]|nr:BrnT family toxin [Shinella sp.]
MHRIIAGFDWDQGNWPKCAKHGVSKEEIESLFDGDIAVHTDPVRGEERLRAIGRTAGKRYVFVVFTLREIGGRNFIRPISARYMHEREIRRYEQE